jgi:hypothetical protein
MRDINVPGHLLRAALAEADPRLLRGLLAGHGSPQSSFDALGIGFTVDFGELRREARAVVNRARPPASAASREAGIRARHGQTVTEATAEHQQARAAAAWANPFLQEPGTVWRAPWSTPAEDRSDSARRRHAATTAALAPKPPQRRC